jgi:predicted regulator of Ras-like GTPase activity (Roadblock/LC7/MglB family)
VSFVENLRKISNNLEDSLGVALVGMDGIVVEEHRRDNLLDLSALAAEFSAVLRQLEEVSEGLHFGQAQELCVLADKGLILIKKINPEYFLLLVIHSEGNFGKGRYLLRREVAHLEKEL